MLPSTTRPPRRNRLPGSSSCSATWVGVTKKATLSCSAASTSPAAPPTSRTARITRARRLLLAQSHGIQWPSRQPPSPDAGLAGLDLAARAHRPGARGRCGRTLARSSSSSGLPRRAACRLCRNRPTISARARWRTPTRHRPHSHPSPDSRSSSTPVPARARPLGPGLGCFRRQASARPAPTRRHGRDRPAMLGARRRRGRRLAACPDRHGHALDLPLPRPLPPAPRDRAVPGTADAGCRPARPAARAAAARAGPRSSAYFEAGGSAELVHRELSRQMDALVQGTLDFAHAASTAARTRPPARSWP